MVSEWAKGTAMNRNTKRILTILCSILLSLGNSGGPIFLRMYYIHGGHGKWLPAILETAGFPILLLPLAALRVHRRKTNPSAPLVHLTPRLLLSAAAIGILTGLDDFLYAYSLGFLPVSTSAVLIATQLAFTALFAYFIVRQRFTAYSVNAVALLSVGAAVLAMRASGDRPPGVTAPEYWKGFALTLTAAALYGLVLPLVELSYAVGGTAISFTVVLEMQLVIGFFATAFCAVGMLVNKEFQEIPREAAKYGLGESKYYAVIICAAIFWQCFFVGAVGVIACVNTLLAGILIAVFIPVLELLAFIFLHENFSGEKAVALVLSLWGLASYSYGEYRLIKKMNKEHQALQPDPDPLRSV